MRLRVASIVSTSEIFRAINSSGLVSLEEKIFDPETLTLMLRETQFASLYPSTKWVWWHNVSVMNRL